MEEQKKNVVEMKPQMQETARPEKMSYEQLENIAHQLSNQNRQLYISLQEAKALNVTKRLDYLFKVVKYSERFNLEFVNSCISEIEESLKIEETTEENTNEEA
jgi:hypothetical protein